METAKINRKVNRRGITPIMITLLLISFAVAVGVVIMSLGRAQVEDQAQCPIDINLKFAVIGGQEQYCYGNNQLSFTLENGVNIKVEGLIVNIIGAQKAETFELNDAKLIKAGTYVGNLRFDSAVGGQIRQVKITPKVVLYDEEQICTEKALILESIKSC